MSDYYSPEELDAMPTGRRLRDENDDLLTKLDDGEWSCSTCSFPHTARNLRNIPHGQPDPLRRVLSLPMWEPLRELPPLNQLHGPGGAKVTRLEVIDETGRAYVGWNKMVQASTQDGGCTLKLFVSPLKES